MDATYWWNGSLVSGAVEYRLAQFGQEFINRHLYLSDLLFLFFWKRTRRKPGKFPEEAVHPLPLVWPSALSRNDVLVFIFLLEADRFDEPGPF